MTASELIIILQQVPADTVVYLNSGLDDDTDQSPMVDYLYNDNGMDLGGIILMQAIKEG